MKTLLIALILASTTAGAETYTITDPFNVMDRKTVRTDSRGNGYVQDTFNPMNRQTIRTQGGRTVIYDTFNPMNRRVIRKR